MIALIFAVMIAILDTGIDLSHPHFIDSDIQTYNVVDQSLNVADDCMHGTGVAGIVKNYAAYNVEILVVKITEGCFGNSEWLAAGIIYASDQQADIITISVGHTYPSKIMLEAIEYAAVRGNIVIFAAAGNKGTDEPFYPSAFENVVAVGCDPEKYPYSNYGDWVDQIEECRAYIPLTINGEHVYAYGSGTSFAAPVAAGKLAFQQSGVQKKFFPILFSR